MFLHLDIFKDTFVIKLVLIKDHGLKLLIQEICTDIGRCFSFFQVAVILRTFDQDTYNNN